MPSKGCQSDSTDGRLSAQCTQLGAQYLPPLSDVEQEDNLKDLISQECLLLKQFHWRGRKQEASRRSYGSRISRNVLSFSENLKHVKIPSSLGTQDVPTFSCAHQLNSPGVLFSRQALHKAQKPKHDSAFLKCLLTTMATCCRSFIFAFDFLLWNPQDT